MEWLQIAFKFCWLMRCNWSATASVLLCLHQNNMLPGNMCPGRATCIRIHICWRTHVAGYKLLVRDTCYYLGDIITIHLCHGRLVSLCIQQQTGNKLATILLPIQETRWQQHVDTSGYNLLPGNMCPGVNAALDMSASWTTTGAESWPWMDTFMDRGAEDHPRRDGLT